MLMEMARDADPNSKVTFQDGNVWVNNQIVLSLENVPLYSKNETVQRAISELNRLNAEFQQASQELETDPDNEELKLRRRRLNHQCLEISKELHRLEEDMLSLYQTAMEKCEQPDLSFWEREALLKLDEGDYEGAKAILRDPKHDEELHTAEAMADLGVLKIRQYISAKRTLIRTIQTTGLNQESVKEISDLYENIVGLAERHRIELHVLYEYAYFLYNQRQYPSGIEKAERLQLYYQLDTTISQKEWGDLLNLLGLLYPKSRKFKEAKNCCQQALEICRRLAKDNPSAYEVDVATTCNNLAGLLDDLNRKPEAEQLYREALEIYRRLAKDNPDVYEASVATICNNLAGLLDSINQKPKAEPLYREALKILRRLAKDNPSAYEADVATTCNNLAGLLDSINRKPEAEELFRKALEIRRRLAKDNPDAYEADVANSCNNLAVLLDSINRKSEAEKLFQKALEIYRRMAKDNPAA